MNLRIDIDLNKEQQEAWIRIADRIGIEKHTFSKYRNTWIPVDVKTRIKKAMETVCTEPMKLNDLIFDKDIT